MDHQPSSDLPVKIGLEIHVQLRTKSKLFCSCSADYRSASANSNICPICTGQPGSKPKFVNKSAVENAIKMALALNSNVNLNNAISMQRKHYFYPDLPSGYQRTSKPIATGGSLKDVTFTEMHIEEDPGQFELRDGTVDYNRSGVPLVEIVTEPEFKDPKHAREFLEELLAILDYLSAASIQPGSLRVDANISVAGNNRVEVKNINSFKGVFTALTFESARQKNLVKNNLPVARETRHFDESRGTTSSLRRKEDAQDYRYFSDPDVSYLILSESQIQEIKKTLPELPSEKRNRFCKVYGLIEEEAFAITLEKYMADCYEQVAKSVDSKIAGNFFRGILKKQLNYRGLSMVESELTSSILIKIIKMMTSAQITEKVAEQLLIAVLDLKADPQEYAEKNNLLGIQEQSTLNEIIDKAISENPQAVKDYLSGKQESINFISGIVMKLTRGKADPKHLQLTLKEKFDLIKKSG